MVLMKRVGVSVHFPHAFLGPLWEVSGEEDIFFSSSKLRTGSGFSGSWVNFSSVRKSIRLQMFPLGTLPSSGLMPAFESCFCKWIPLGLSSST